MTKRSKSILGVILLIIGLLAVCSMLTSNSKGGSGSGTSSGSDVKLPTLSVGSQLDDTEGYISFLGDSITTYSGYSNNTAYNSTIGGNGVYYTSSKMIVNETWWYQTAVALNMGLCVNNSWDGSRVTDTKATIPSGVERASELHNDNTGKKPDVIVIYMGTNDVGNGIALETFEAAYTEMLNVVKTNYPTADVYCCTLLPESRTEGRTEELEAYNDSIKTMTQNAGYTVIDFYEEISDWDYTSDTFVDGTLRVHPTAAGMDKLSRVAVQVIQANR